MADRLLGVPQVAYGAVDPHVPLVSVVAPAAPKQEQKQKPSAPATPSLKNITDVATALPIGATLAAVLSHAPYGTQANTLAWIAIICWGLMVCCYFWTVNMTQPAAYRDKTQLDLQRDFPDGELDRHYYMRTITLWLAILLAIATDVVAPWAISMSH